MNPAPGSRDCVMAAVLRRKSYNGRQNRYVPA